MADIFSQFDRMASDMMKDFGGMREPGSMVGGRAGGGLGGGQYACQSFAMCSRMGPDGKQHVEKYSSSDVGNTQHGIRESQQAYSNSSTGVDKMALERQLGDQGRKVVRERNRHTADERSTELFRGMDESGKDAFDSRFAAHRGHLPAHGALPAAGLPGAGARALPGHPGRAAAPRPAAISDIGSTWSGRSAPGGGTRRL
ncbi:unnamed protein product [Prorocentrum cordatum]|uniref:Myeloid leukemia factor 1 n=1 Tax=Prorocentrum cordatum TaxID=2364126 RepID=A0ABN9V798_9DINO|nr:unnamed protein product [Polarella glacialis]